MNFEKNLNASNIASKVLFALTNQSHVLQWKKKSFKHTPNLTLEEAFTWTKLLRQREVEVKQWFTVLCVQVNQNVKRQPFSDLPVIEH